MICVSSSSRASSTGSLRPSSLGVGSAVVALGLVLFACASDDAARVTSATTDAGPDANRRRDGEAPVETRSCVETCRADHASGVAKDEAITACWATRCPVCAGGSPPNDAGNDGRDAGDGGDAPVTCGATPVVTALAACDRCTAASCCAAWEACFDDADCRALNACYQRCPSD